MKDVRTFMLNRLPLARKSPLGHGATDKDDEFPSCRTLEETETADVGDDEVFPEADDLMRAVIFIYEEPRLADLPTQLIPLR